MDNKKHVFYVKGMSCNSCTILVENELLEYSEVESLKTDLINKKIEIMGNFENHNSNDVAAYLSRKLLKHGYKLSLEKEKKDFSEFKIVIPIVIIFFIFFFLLQKNSLISLKNLNSITYGNAFIIGIVASFSSCMAVVGSLLLSISATFSKKGDRIKPQILFHLGRFISFFVLGGLIGFLGTLFTISIMLNFVLNLFIAIIMIILGINLLDIFDLPKKWQIRIPKFLKKSSMKLAKINSVITPFLVGIMTFFLPCGFTQSMQFYTLSTGDFIIGGLTMLFFALGTMPILFLISFSSLKIKKIKTLSIFFKVSGIIVIIFSLFNIINNFVMIGLIPPIFIF